MHTYQLFFLPPHHT